MAKFSSGNMKFLRKSNRNFKSGFEYCFDKFTF